MLLARSTMLAASIALFASSCASRAHDRETASASPSSSTAPATAATTSGELRLSPPSEWTPVATTSAMRKAQYALPRAEGDAQDASLVVYFFGGQGGSREANLERWAAQFEQPDGRASKDVLTSSTRKVNGLDVLDVQLSGTYVAETAPGSGVRVREEGWRMLASIVDTPKGPYYVKLVGPGRTVERWSSAYRAFVSRLEYAP